MAINLSKGQKIDLTKGNPGLTTLKVGLGWDEIKKRGFFGSKSVDIDCDASVLLLNEAGKLGHKKNLVYYGNLKHDSRSVIHQGDNLTGEGDGDDEVIVITLPKVPAEFHRLLFVVNIYDAKSRKLDFGMIENAFIRVVNDSNNVELARYNLSEDYKGKTALYVGEVYRHGGEWKFAAIGQGTNDYSLTDVVNKYK